MFSAIRRIPSSLGLRRLLYSKPQNKPKNIGSSQVTLVGKVVMDPYILPSGAKSILLETYDEQYGKSQHRIHTKRNITIAEGQYLHVNGPLSSVEFFTTYDKKRHDCAVQAMGLTILSTYQYINTVEIKAYVATDIINTEHFSMFGLVTTHLQDGNLQPRVNYFPIRVYGEELRNLASGLEKTRSIRLIGMLQYSHELDKNQKNRKATFIRASNIMILGSSSFALDDERKKDRRFERISAIHAKPFNE